MSELIAIEKINPTDLFTPQGVDNIIKAIEEKIGDVTSDISTEKNRKEIASIAYQITRSKTALDDIGKNMVAQWKTKSKAVDSQRKKIRDGFDDLKDKIRKPLNDWENAEKNRVKELEEKLSKMSNLINIFATSPDQISQLISELEELNKTSWQEFESRATSTYNLTSKILKERLSEAKKQEEQRAELESLQKEKIAEEAVQKEKIAEEAVQKERERIEAKKQAEILENEKRATNQDHTKKINNKILDYLIDTLGLESETAKKLIIAIANGNVPHTSIKY